MKSKLLSIFLLLSSLSAASAQQVNITFNNRTDGPVSLFWVDGSGNEISYGVIPVGQPLSLTTYPNHSWRFKSGNQIIGAMIASANPTQSVDIKKAGQPQPAPVTQPSQPAGGAGLSQNDALQLLQLVNQARNQNGAPPLSYNTKLTLAAGKHSQDMAARNYFSHTAPQPAPNGAAMSERATNAGYQWSQIAENIASGQTTVQAVFNSWMNSPGHKANILNPAYAEMGIGRAGNLWTQMFGKSW